MTAATDDVRRLLERSTRDSGVPMVPTDPAALARLSALLKCGGRR